MYFEEELFFFIFARPNGNGLYVQMASGFIRAGIKLKMVVVAQLVRASDCDSEGRGFEPPRLPFKSSLFTGNFFYY